MYIEAHKVLLLQQFCCFKVYDENFQGSSFRDRFHGIGSSNSRGERSDLRRFKDSPAPRIAMAVL